MVSSSPQGNATCAYWDEDEYRWSTEGVTALGTTNSELRCETTHLSIFGAAPLTKLCDLTVRMDHAADVVRALSERFRGSGRL